MSYFLYNVYNEKFYENIHESDNHRIIKNIKFGPASNPNNLLKAIKK